MSPITLNAVVSGVVALVAAAAVFAWWVANKKRIAAETIGRADEQAQRLVKDAEREADTRRKEALLDAKEKSHELLMEAERQAHLGRQQAGVLEQALARRETSLTDRQGAIERLEKELNTRDRVLTEREKAAAADTTPTGDSLRLAVLAALNIADELFRCRDLSTARSGEIAERTGELERLLDRVLMAS